MGWLSDVGKSIVGSSGKILGSALGVAGGLFGSSLDRSYRTDQWNNEYNAQKEFAQNGIRWRVADAKAAGIHPLAALGAQTASYSPQSISSSNYGDTFASMGQDLGRAIGAKQTDEEREIGRLTREGLELDNEFKKANIENVRSQTVSREIDDVTRMVLASQKETSSQQQVPPMPSITKSARKGWGQDIPYLSKVYDHNGNIVAIIPSPDLHDAVEDIPGFEWGPYFDVTRKMIAQGEIGGYYLGSDGYWHKGKKPKSVPKKTPASLPSGGMRKVYGG